MAKLIGKNVIPTCDGLIHSNIVLSVNAEGFNSRGTDAKQYSVKIGIDRGNEYSHTVDLDKTDNEQEWLWRFARTFAGANLITELHRPYSTRNEAFEYQNAYHCSIIRVEAYLRSTSQWNVEDREVLMNLYYASEEIHGQYLLFAMRSKPENFAEFGETLLDEIKQSYPAWWKEHKE